MNVFFVPGLHPSLSLAEIQSLDPESSFTISNGSILVGEINKDLGAITSSSGGIVKAGIIVSELESYNKDVVAAMLASFVEPVEGKLPFGISLYGGSRLAKSVEALGLTVKKVLKKREQSSRFVTSKQETLSAVVITKNHLLEKGAEFVLIESGNKILLGQTMFVQPFENWSHRDYDRPARNPRSGMLPPKLARMMINLAKKTPSESSLWDPFCGSGTILMEAELLGYKQVVGSDINEKAVADSKRNLNWLKEHYGTDKPEIFEHDAINDLEEPREFDLIVAEGFLGKPRKTFLAHKAELQDLEKFYPAAFPKLAESLKVDGVVIFAIPFYRTREGFEYLDIKIEGLEIIPFEGDVSPRGGLRYIREKQFIGREILKLRKN